MATRYQLGDVLLPEAENLATALPRILAQSKANQLDERRLNQESRKIGIAESRAEESLAFRDQQAKLAQQNYLQQQEFNQSQAKLREMNGLLASVDEPYQKQVIYNKYKMYDMAAQMKVQGDKEQGYKDTLISFHSLTDSKDIMMRGAETLQNLDPTSSAYSEVNSAYRKAVEDEASNAPELIADLYYGPLYRAEVASLQLPNADRVQIGINISNIQEQFSRKQASKGSGGGSKEEVRTPEEEETELLSSFFTAEDPIPTDTLDFQTPTEGSVKKLAESVMSSSTVNISNLSESVNQMKNRKDILTRTGKFRDLSPAQTKELAKLKESIDVANKELKRQRGSVREAIKELGLERRQPAADIFRD